MSHWVVDRVTEGVSALSVVRQGELHDPKGWATFNLYGKTIPAILLNGMKFRAQAHHERILRTCEHVKLMRLLAVIMEVADALNPEVYDETYRVLSAIDAALEFLPKAILGDMDAFVPNNIKRTLMLRVRQFGTPSRVHHARLTTVVDSKNQAEYRAIVCTECGHIMHMGSHDMDKLPAYLNIMHHVCGYDWIDDDLKPLGGTHCGVRKIRLRGGETHERHQHQPAEHCLLTGSAGHDTAARHGGTCRQEVLPGTQGALEAEVHG